jgi:glucokinase
MVWLSHYSGRDVRSLMEFAIGIDIGGTLIKTVAVSRDGELLYRDTIETRDVAAYSDPAASKSLNVQYWVRSLGEQIEKIKEALSSAASCIGIAAPGIVDEKGTSVASMPGRLKGLEGLVWSEVLDQPCIALVLNDAHAALLGETWIGSAAGIRNVAMITLGTGVGGALMMDGKLVRGTIGRAGHIGHICLDPYGIYSICRAPGGLEWFVGDYSIKERSGGKYSSTRELVEDYKKGKHFASSLWLYTVRALACGIVSVINLVDPEAVVLGGGLTEADEALFEPLSEMLEEFEWRAGGHAVRIIKASLGEHGGAIGAARNAFQNSQEG